MTPKVPELDSVAWFQVVGLQPGIEVGLKHVDPKRARSWGLRALQVQLDERTRVADHRRDRTADTHPHLFAPDYETPEGIQAVVDLALDVLDACLDGVRGIDGDSATFVAMLDVAALVALMEAGMSLQRLPDRFRATPPGASDLGAGESS